MDDRVLGEPVRYRASLHGSVFMAPLTMLAAGLGATLVHPMIAVVLLLTGAVGVFGAYAHYASTEILVTSRRVVYRTGVLARRTVEMHMDRIESIDVWQSMLGRLLDFGSVTVKGTGGGIEAMRHVRDPWLLRRHVADPRSAGAAFETQSSPLWGVPIGAAPSRFG
jgi:uncharacterized membrane protein YdbT with pleckstrin-like domain